MKPILKVALTALVLSGCSAEGNSAYLGSGPTKRFLTMNTCEKEALRRHPSGGRVYAGFECRKMLLGTFQIEERRY